MEIETFTLIKSENEILGITPLLKGDHVIVTIQSQGVYIYNVVTQQCRESWLLQPGTKFTYPVVLHCQTLITVNENKWLWSWNRKKDLKSVSKIQFPSKGDIFSVLVSEQLVDHFVLIFRNGIVCLIKEDIEIESEACAKDISSHNKKPDFFPVVWSDTVHKQQEVVITILRKSPNSFLLDIFLASSKNSKGFISHAATHNLSAETSEISCCAFDISTNSISILYSSMWLFIYKTQTLDDVFQNNSFHLIYKRKIQTLHPNMGLGCKYLCPGQLVLIGTHQDQEPHPSQETPSSPKPLQEGLSLKFGVPLKFGVTSQFGFPDRALLLLWDTNNGIVKGKFLFEETVTHKGPAVKGVATSIDQSKVYIAFKGSVVICPISCSPPTLAAAINSYELTKSVLDKNDPICVEDSRGVHLDLKLIMKEGRKRRPHIYSKEELSDTLSAILSKEDYFIAKLTNRDETPTLTHFLEIFSEVTVGTQNGQSPFSQFSQNFSVKVANRCLQDSFWKPLEFLLDAKTISYYTLPKMLEILMEKEKIGMIAKILLNVADIPPKEIVGLAKYFISTVRRDIMEMELGEMLVKTEMSGLDIMLCLLVSYPINQHLMRPWIKLLTEKEVLALLSFLTDIHWLFYQKSISSFDKIWNGKKILDSKLLLNWCNMILDTHLAMLVLGDECNEAIVNLDNAITAHAHMLENMASLQGVVQSVINQSPLPKKNMSDYTLDLLLWPDSTHFELKSNDKTPKKKKSGTSTLQ